MISQILSGWDDNFEDYEEQKLNYIDILQENCVPLVESIKHLIPGISTKNWFKTYFFYIKAQNTRDRCLQLSPAQELILAQKDPHYRICKNFKLKFSRSAYKSLKKKCKNVYDIKTQMS